MRRTRHVNAFCPRLFSAIRLPDNVLASRSIVIPLIRTADRHVANVDPLDGEAWPHERRQLIDDLWALALAHLPALRECERTAIRDARLAGRTLEPWRAILADALWLDGHDPDGVLKRSERPSPTGPLADEEDDDRERPETGLWERMEALSVAYQRERSGLETDDLTTLVIHAMCCCAVSAIRAVSANSGETPSEFVFTTAQITAFVQTITQRNEGDPNYVTSRRIGRVLGQMRLEKAPRPGGKGSRRWRVTLGDLARWTAAYGLPLPGPLAPNADDGSP